MLNFVLNWVRLNLILAALVYIGGGSFLLGQYIGHKLFIEPEQTKQEQPREQRRRRQRIYIVYVQSRQITSQRSSNQR